VIKIAYGVRKGCVSTKPSGLAFEVVLVVLSFLGQMLKLLLIDKIHNKRKHNKIGMMSGI
jgi:hypothetical protein